MADVYDKIKEKGITLPASPPKGGVYAPVREFGINLLYCLGCSSDLGGSTIIGKSDRDLTVEEGQKVVYNCALNLLTNIEAKIGGLNKIKCFVKVLVLVNSANDFVQQPQVTDGVSSLLVELFSEEIGCPACFAIRTNVPPDGIAREIEVLLEAET